jgi:hypothetical protein
MRGLACVSIRDSLERGAYGGRKSDYPWSGWEGQVLMSETLTPEARDARRAERRHHQRRIQLFGAAGVAAAIILGVVL